MMAYNIHHDFSSEVIFKLCNLKTTTSDCFICFNTVQNSTSTTSPWIIKHFKFFFENSEDKEHTNTQCLSDSQKYITDHGTISGGVMQHFKWSCIIYLTPDTWHLLALTSTSISGVTSWVVANLRMWFKCLCVGLEHIFVLFMLITEKTCSQRYVVPNMHNSFAVSSVKSE